VGQGLYGIGFVAWLATLNYNRSSEKYVSDDPLKRNSNPSNYLLFIQIILRENTPIYVAYRPILSS
jgi:hypothetical protein